MQLISTFIKWFRFLLCVINIYSKNAWVVTLKVKKGITINFCKIWVDQGSELYNRPMK